jgi:hypothetical protein
MRLSDFKGEEAIDVLADIIEPLTYILADEEIQTLSQQKNVPTLKYVKPMLKNHKAEVIEVLARLENKSVEEYKESLNLITLPMQVLELINDPEVQNLFPSQEQSQLTPLASSSPAMENTEAKGN